MTSVLWNLDHVTLNGDSRRRLDDVSLSIDRGVTAVMGQSGAGKSSLLNVLVGFERVDEGQLRREFSTDTGLPLFWVPQSSGLWSHLTVSEHLTMVAATDELATDLLEAFDLSSRRDARPDALSEGERHRLAVARALAAEPNVLVMDEPFANVDASRARHYWEAIAAKRKQVRPSMSIVFASHCAETVLREAERVVCLHNGQIVHESSTDSLYCKPTSRELAELLGPANWFGESREATRWIDGLGDRQCLRPEQIKITRDANSPLQVVSARQSHWIGELEIQDTRSHEHRRFTHRPNGEVFRAGDRIVLKVLSLWCALLLILGCQRHESPQLNFTHVAHWSMPPANRSIPAPRAVSIGEDQEIFVLDNAGRVLVFAPDGALIRQWEMPEHSVGNPEGILVCSDGRIAVADTHYHRVVFFDRDGNVQSMHGQLGKADGEFIYPVAIAEDDEGNYYVCEYGENDRVQKFSRDGTFQLEFGSFGTEPGQFQRPSGVVWHDGKIYVADAINNRVQVFSDTGDFISVLKQPEGTTPLHYPYDLMKDRDGRLYMTEYGAGCLTCVERDGSLIGRWGSTGSAKGQLATPWGMAVGADGQIIVADTGNRRLVELRK